MKMLDIGTMSLEGHPKGYDIVNYKKIESCSHSARGDMMYILISTYIIYKIIYQIIID